MKNIVWLMIDSLSSLYINKETMPYLSSMLDKSLYFPQCIATTPYTTGAFYSMITGRYAQHNGYNAFGLHRTEQGKKSFTKEYGKQSNLFRSFRDKGYYTALDSPVSSTLDWCRGIDRASRLDESVHKVIERPTKEPFLWMFHYMGIHRSTLGNNGILNTNREKFQRVVLPEHDKKIQAFIEEYTRPEDIIVLNSDHGITWVLGTEMHHGATLYESGIRILFAIHGVEPGRVEEMMRSVDIGPTLLHLINTKLEDTDGVDLLSEPPNPEVVIETGPSRETPDFHSRFGIRDNNCKYIFNWEEESLHDITKLVSHEKYISDDGINVENPGLLTKYREKLISYMDKYGLDIQKKKLLTVSNIMQPPIAERKAKNIVWLFIDSFSNLDVNEDTMPFLSSLLEESLYFSQCVTAVPYTASSFYTQTTGRYGQHHGYKCYWPNQEEYIAAGYHKQSSIFTKFGEAGYYTKLMSPTHGNKDWIEGIDECVKSLHPWPFSHGEKLPLVELPPPDEGDILKLGLKRPDKEPFVWVYHYLGMHHITCHAIPKNMKRKKYRKDLLPYLDRQLRLFVEEFIKPDDILLITSDHGIGWDKRAERHHGASICESGIRIIFAIKGLGLKGEYGRMVRSIDVGPTLLHLLGEELDDTDGVDLIASIETSGDVPDLETIIETGGRDKSPYWHSIMGVRDNQYKYVFDWWNGESLHRVDDLIRDDEYVWADGAKIENKEQIGAYREKLIAYAKHYLMDKQKNRLLELANPRKNQHIEQSIAKDNLVRVNVNGYSMMIFPNDAHISPRLLKEGVWEPGTTEFIKKNLKSGQVFVDVGAHIGYFSLLASKIVGDEGKVFAFEPDPENFKVLQTNLALNHMKNVVPFQKALWDSAGEATLYGYGNRYRMYPTLVPDRIAHPKAKLDGSKTTVETAVLDGTVSDCDMIKIDVEGAEIEVLRGMAGILEMDKPKVILEDRRGDGLKLLADMGFKAAEVGRHTYALENKDIAPPILMYDRKFRIHILGVPHTKTTIEYAPCAFTQKVYRFCEMMTNAGHEVIHYGAEGSNPVCSEHVTVLSDEIQKKIYGHVNWKDGFFEPHKEDEAYTTFNRNAVTEIDKRRRPGDFLVVSMGSWHRPVTDNVKGVTPVELGIGYSGCYLKHKIFESYAWMYYIYGQRSPKDVANIKWYDAVIPNYFDPKDFIFRDKKEDYFFFIGRLISRKGAYIAQQVVDELVRQGHKTKLLVAGQGDIRKALDPGPNVEYVGVVDVRQRANYMSRAKAVFVPSVYFEPFGHVVIEAALCGTPIISTDYGAFPELVIHGHTGYRCRTFDQFVWAAKNVDKISPQTCRKWAEDNFSMERVAKMYEEYLGALTDGYEKKGWYIQHPEREDLGWLTKSYPVGV